MISKTIGCRGTLFSDKPIYWNRCFVFQDPTPRTNVLMPMWELKALRGLLWFVHGRGLGSRSSRDIFSTWLGYPMDILLLWGQHHQAFVRTPGRPEVRPAGPAVSSPNGLRNHQGLIWRAKHCIYTHGPMVAATNSALSPSFWSIFHECHAMSQQRKKLPRWKIFQEDRRFRPVLWCFAFR